MALTPSTTLVHLPFGERPDYGSPYPEGVAVAHIDQTGDASGGSITASILAQDQFLYRLELINVTEDSETTNDMHVALISEWASQMSGFGPLAFSLDWHMQQLTGNGFSQQVENTQNAPGMRRQILGSLTPGAGQFVAVITVQNNVDTNVYDFDMMFTYWPKQALFLPGFLSAFYEAPAAPPVIPFRR